MRIVLVVILLVLVGCQTRPEVTIREYRMPSLTLTYAAPTRIDPVFTFIARTPQDREDGAVYITSDPPSGVLGTKPGRSFAIFILPRDRFTSGLLSEALLAEILPPKLALNHPNETFEARTEQISGRIWTVVTSRRKNTARDITGVSYYSRADEQHLVYVAWSYPALSADVFEKEASARRLTLESVKIAPHR